jgi:CRISPR-associated protein (TIGR03986 family)
MAKGKIEKLDKAGKNLTIKGKEYSIGKKTWNREGLENKIDVGVEIEFNIKGANFEFIKVVSSEEKSFDRGHRRSNDGFSRGSVKKMELFSYPYNFVGLSSEVKRDTYRKGEYSGTIECTLRNISPLFIAGEKLDDGSGHQREYFLHDGKNYLIPGSSIKGGIRSVFEAVTASCIRNIEGERLEERKTAGDFNDRIYGIIKRLPTKDEDGLIVEAGVARISHENIPSEYRRGRDLIEGWHPLELTAGIKNYESSNTDKDPRLVRDLGEVTGRAQIDGGLFIGSQIYGKKKEKIIFKKQDGKNYPLTFEEYENIRYIVNQRKAREAKADKKYNFEAPISGDAIIFQADSKGRAKNLAFSEIPRLRYKLSPYDLLKEDYKGCKTIKKACLTCRTFGMAGNDKESKTISEEDKDVLSARGKVFFTDAKADKKEIDSKGGIQSEAKLIKSLGEPHPTQMAFYLEKGGKNDTYDSSNSIRGRKFYWHHKDKLEKNYNDFKKSITPEEKAKHNSSIQFMNYGNEFTFSVRYESLDKEELDALVYSLELEEGMLHKVGKAKALGFGSCKITVDKITSDSLAKYNSFDFAQENLDKSSLISNYLKTNYGESKERKELQMIMGVKNVLDFSKSPFPEDEIPNKPRRGYNTLNWFMNMKKQYKESFRLPEILEYK